MNEDQETAVLTAKKGHSFLLTGQAGTGKTMTCIEIMKTLTGDNKNIILCCATGIACKPLSQQGAQTLHRVFGLKDGRYDCKQLEVMFTDTSDKYYGERRKRIQDADVLIIDEISMISRHILNMVDSICRHVRCSSKALGGLQAIFIGDFFQLPPVPNTSYGDKGEFCFKHPSFRMMVPHTLKLVQVLRQDESLLITAIQELARGKVSNDTKAFLRSLERPVLSTPVVKKHALFAENASAKCHNQKILNLLPGETKVYESKDEGDAKYLDKIPVGKKLALKVGSRVMLMKNMTDEVVNGMQGWVRSMERESVTVKLDDMSSCLTFTKELFTKYDPQVGKDVAKRWQLPLQLSFGTTIHKAQGLTLTDVVVNCSGIFAPGQLSVALGRAKQTSGLQVMNFIPSRHIIPAKEEVVAFDLDTGVPLDEVNMSCCVNDVPVEAEALIDVPVCDESVLCQDDDAILNTLKELMADNEADVACDEIDSETNMDETDSDEIPDMQEAVTIESTPPLIKLKLCAIFNSRTYFRDEIVKINEEDESENEKKGLLMQYLEMSSVQELADTAALELHKQWEGCKKTSPGQSSFFAFYHSFTLQKFPNMVRDTIGEVSEKGYFLLVQMLKAIRFKIMSKSQNITCTQTTELGDTDIKLSSASEGKIRYLAGRSVAKAKKNAERYLLENSGKSALEEECSKVQKTADHLSYMRISYELLGNSAHKKSLAETERKQNLARGLTHVSDETFLFYIDLEKERIKLHNLDNATANTGNVLAAAVNSLLQSANLFTKFQDIFAEMPHANEECIKALYKQLVNGYISVANNEFRKVLCTLLRKKRKFRHRVQICTGNGKKQKKCVKSTCKSGDTSGDKVGTGKGGETSELVTGKGKKCEKQKSKGKLKKSADEVTEPETICPLCKLVYKDTEDWIGCDKCNHWYDRKCAGLLTNKRWNVYQGTDESWVCRKCKK